MSNFINGKTYVVITNLGEDGEPALTFSAVWNEAEQIFDSEEGWVGLDDVAYVIGHRAA